MYTRVYQGKSQPLPQDYHGTAFSEEESTTLPPTEEVPFPPREEPKEEPKEQAEATPCDEKAKKEHTADEKESWGADILLLAICALLVQNEEADTRLLALLLLLLLSPNT